MADLLSEGFGAAQSLLGGVGSFISGQEAAAGTQAEEQAFNQEAALYQQAAQLAVNSQSIVRAQGNLEAAQLNRQIEMTQGTAEAVAGTGNYTGSTLGDILAENQRQGSLAVAQAQGQTALEEQNFATMALGYEAQSAAATGEAQKAVAAAKAQSSGGFLGILGGVVGAVAKFIP